MPRKSTAPSNATPTTATPPGKGALRQLRMILIKLIDPPEIAMRVNINDDKIADLAASIRDTGLIYPLCVFAHEGRYEIASGHCRYLACKLLGRDEVECWDYTHTNMDPAQIKAHENLFRQDPNDGELIQWLEDEQEKRPLTLEELRRMTGKSEHWINTRMSIVRGDPAVRLALTMGEINLSQATELNKFPDDYRATYLHTVKESTPPVHLIAKWRADVNLIVSHQNPGAVVPPPVPVEAMPGIAPVCSCVLCESVLAPWEIQTYNIHRTCLDAIVKQLRNGGA